MHEGGHLENDISAYMARAVLETMRARPTNVRNTGRCALLAQVRQLRVSSTEKYDGVLNQLKVENLDKLSDGQLLVLHDVLADCCAQSSIQ